jgi:cell volume regulation protein A
LLAFLALWHVLRRGWPGGILFDNYFAAYAIGGIALAIILFDGGLRTDFANFRMAAWPALLLATIGVGYRRAHRGRGPVAGSGWVEIDRRRGRLDRRRRGVLPAAPARSRHQAAVRSVLEVESGLNAPMAVFPDGRLRRAVLADGAEPTWSLALDFANQIAGGAAIGLPPGFALVWLINRLELAAGLYPILAMAWALFTSAARKRSAPAAFSRSTSPV